MKILYRSVHEILEHDELTLLTSLGHQLYSLGSYTDPCGDQGRMRPPIQGMAYDEEFFQMAVANERKVVTEPMLEPMDMVIVMHDVDFLLNNWKKLRRKRVVWRTIGQSVAAAEHVLRPLREDGLQIVRYSPAEAAIPGYLGADSMIRFAKDPTEYQGWTGREPRVIGFTHDMVQRGTQCSWELVEQLGRQLPFTLYGRNNESIPFSGGLLPYEKQREVFQSARAFLSVGTHPASYTLGFIEAWMTGLPVVAIGPTYGNPHRSGHDQDTYEVPELIEDGVNGFCRDDVRGLLDAFEVLLKDEALARSIGEAGRQRAIELFGVDTIREQWKHFLA